MRARTAHERAVITVCAQTLCDGVTTFFFDTTGFLTLVRPSRCPRQRPTSSRRSPTSRRERAVNRLRTQPHNMSYPRTRELTTALNSMETWWSSANQGNGRSTTTLTNGGGSSSALTTINRGALSAQLQSSVPRAPGGY